MSDIAISFRSRIEFDREGVLNRVEKAGYKNMGHWAASVMRIARNSIRPGAKKIKAYDYVPMKRPPRNPKSIDIGNGGPESTRKYAYVDGQWYRRVRAKGRDRTVPVPSKPGEPPRSHTGLLKKRIFYGFAPSDRTTVIVGPMLTRRRSSKTVPELLEYGGVTTPWQRPGKRRITILPRPYMGPALQKSKDQAAQVWRNSVTK